ncbi:MAG: hypothetical protein K1X94_24500 [Sandaracinaceae bacterium]|nr:hypothetical protein [Sandaracinaceae bacterium]
MSVLGKLKLRTDARESSSARREIPTTMRGVRTVTRIADLLARAQEAGIVPTTLALTLADEIVLFDHAGEVLGEAGGQAAAAGPEAWRAFLANWARDKLKVTLVFEAPSTTVT